MCIILRESSVYNTEGVRESSVYNTEGVRESSVYNTEGGFSLSSQSP